MERTTKSVLRMMVRCGMAIDITNEGDNFLRDAEHGTGYEKICYSFHKDSGINGCLIKGRYTGKYYAVLRNNSMLAMVW